MAAGDTCSGRQLLGSYLQEPDLPDFRSFDGFKKLLICSVARFLLYGWEQSPSGRPKEVSVTPGLHPTGAASLPGLKCKHGPGPRRHICCRLRPHEETCLPSGGDGFLKHPDMRGTCCLPCPAPAVSSRRFTEPWAAKLNCLLSSKEHQGPAWLRKPLKPHCWGAPASQALCYDLGQMPCDRRWSGLSTR